MTIIPEEMNANPINFFLSNFETFIPNKPKWSITMEAMDWPSKLNAIVIEAPRAEKLMLLKRTVNTPIAPALYKKVEYLYRNGFYFC